MTYLARARKAADRGDIIRAVLTLIEGLKRHPDDDEALDYFVHLFGLHVDSSGLEHEVIAIIARRPEANELLSVLVDNQRGRGHTRIADQLLQCGREAGLIYVEPPPKPPPSESPSPEASSPELEPADETRPIALAFSDEESEPEAEEGAGDAVASSENATHRGSDAPGQASDANDVHAKQQKKSARREPDAHERARRRWTAVAALILVLVGAAVLGVLLWDRAQRAAALHGLDAHLETLDPFELEELNEDLERANGSWPLVEEFIERRQFVEALEAFRQNAAIELGESEPQTQWGLAAGVLATLQAGDLERALELVTRLERLHSPGLAAGWMRGLLEERRGNYTRAVEHYRSLNERFPAFLPAYLGRTRIAVRRWDSVSIERLTSMVSKFDPEHPYVRLSQFVSPADALLTGDPYDVPAAGQPPDRFFKAVAAYYEALEAIAASNLDEAHDAASKATEHDPSLGVAQVLRGALASSRFRVAEATRAFDAVSRIDGASEQLRTLTQTVGPRALTGAGRPDLGFRFTTPYPAVELEREDATRPEEPSRPPAFDHGALEASNAAVFAHEALFARAAALEQMGHSDLALATLEDLARRGVQPWRARVLARLTGLRSGTASWKPADLDPQGKQVVDVARGYYYGDFRESTEASTEGDHDYARPHVLRYTALSYIAIRKVGEALGLFHEAKLGLVPALELAGVRLRANARLGAGSTAFDALYKSMTSVGPTGMTRLADLAAAAFWKGRIEEASGFAARVLEVEPTNREANWIVGLVRRTAGNFDEATTHLRRSGRNYDASSGLLLELGHVNMRIGNWEEARKMYYKALLIDRSNLDAVRGLGEAYVKVESRVAERDLRRIYRGYPSAKQYEPHRGELMKWLAVLAGVREGEEQGREYVEQAMKHVGERPDMLIEYAKYFEAREERTQARLLYARALQRNSTIPDAHLGLGRMALEDGDTAVARDHLQKYLELAPDGEAASWAKDKVEKIR